MTSKGEQLTSDQASRETPTLDKHSHLPFWEPGCGHYGNTLGKRTNLLMESSKPFILSFIDAVPVKKGHVFTVGDYGTNDGASSMSLFTSVIGHLREKQGDTLPIQIIYEDQEKNDFNSLFRRLSDESSYMSKFCNVYPMATNINFYQQCVPDGTYDVILCMIATHWLESVDTKFTDCVTHCFATQDEQRRFNAEADRDWTKFLRLRAKELKPGGLLIVLNISRDTENNETSPRDLTQGANNGTSPAVKDGVAGLGRNTLALLQELHHAWVALREDNVITQTEYEDCIIKAAYRTSEEITSPFTKSSSMQEAGLGLLHHDQVALPCFFKTQWQETLRKEGVDDRDTYAKSLVSAERVWSQSSFENSLSDMRSAEDKAAILDKLYRSLEKRVASRDPRLFNSHYLVSRLVAHKK
ncbi:uncharacterized protein [Littorina saxatilis]|uniref:uncharacterized protein n=1 Tax=Littorina saxatilis TaxID=31220 RepID=UPI0038B5D6AA